MVKIDKEKLVKLENIIAKYPDILNEFGIKDLIMKAYKFEKPLTSFEAYNRDPIKVTKLIDDLKDFFFIDYINSKTDSQKLIFVSRFRTLLEVAIDYAYNTDCEDEFTMYGTRRYYEPNN